MSNTEASRAYELIVESVINEVREDFENAGIDEQTLQDLKRNWQLKLSETKVADFTWDGALADEDGVARNNAMVQGQAPPLANTDMAEGNLGQPAVKSESIGDNSLVLPGSHDGQPAVKEEGSNAQLPPATPATPATPAEVSSQQQQQEQPAQIELEISDPNGEVADQVKMQQKQAKRSALLDTDEVGSELDDSDDDYLISEGEDDGPDENLMLCLYDKVTRTKARWKCALKDGVVTINHKDYTFQKAQVEAEWV